LPKQMLIGTATIWKATDCATNLSGRFPQGLD
jgi:hypothetical protein